VTRPSRHSSRQPSDHLSRDQSEVIHVDLGYWAISGSIHPKQSDVVESFDPRVDSKVHIRQSRPDSGTYKTVTARFDAHIIQLRPDSGLVFQVKVL